LGLVGDHVAPRSPATTIPSANGTPTITRSSYAFACATRPIGEVTLPVARGFAVDAQRGAVVAARRTRAPFALGGTLDLAVVWRDGTIEMSTGPAVGAWTPAPELAQAPRVSAGAH
jgi:hypothetical protein